MGISATHACCRLCESDGTSVVRNVADNQNVCVAVRLSALNYQQDASFSGLGRVLGLNDF